MSIEQRYPPAVVGFSKEVDRARILVKNPDFLRGHADHGAVNEFCLLRRWNSHTPALLNVWGGGYFLRWQNKVTVVDPGGSFLRMLNLQTRYCLRDIDMIVATHDHFDHCGDLGTLITLLRAYNDLNGKKKHLWDLVVSHGVASQLSSILTHPDNTDSLRWRKTLAPQKIEEMPARRPVAKHPRKIAAKYKYDLQTLRAHHSELLGERTSVGVRFALRHGTRNRTNIVISSDSAIAAGKTSVDGSELVEAYRGADLLVLHVGTMEKPTEERLKQHLGFVGIVEVLRRLAAKRAPKLVVLSEWGYEFGRLGLRGRTRFTELVVEALRQQQCDCYFAATESTGPTRDGLVPILPGDLGLRINLPELKIRPSDGTAPISASEIRAHEGMVRIDYKHA